MMNNNQGFSRKQTRQLTRLINKTGKDLANRLAKLAIVSPTRSEFEDPQLTRPFLGC